MIKFLPKIYKDEIAYSIFARYSALNGNLGYIKISKELFCRNSNNFNIFYPTYIDNFINQLPVEMGITSDNFIKNHTIFPLFKPFMSEKRAELVNKNICHGNSKSLRNRMGIFSGDIFDKNGQSIKICPLCFNEEIDKYGEAYAHRIHQIPGNFVCKEHGVYLYEYSISTNRCIFFDINNIDIEHFQIDEIKEDLKYFYLDLFHDISYILNGGYEKYNINKIQEIYRNKLREKGYLQNTKINQKRLMDDFDDFYPEEFLIKLESGIDKNNSDCWLTNITTAKADFTHPIRHLLFIRFLFGSASSLEDIEGEYNPFGEGPWPCLNHAAEHYNELVINSYHIKSCGKIKGIRGYFKCSCGFEYSRKGPDKSENDKFRATSVIQRGQMWDNKLKDLILNDRLSVSKLEKEMKCSRNVILKHAIDLGIYDKLNTVMKHKSHNAKRVDIDLYKKEIIEFIKNNPDAHRTQIKLNLMKQYLAINKYEKNWLESVLPKPFKDGKAFNRGYKDEDWEELDKKVCNMINDTVIEILNDEKSKRITVNKIAYKINYFWYYVKKKYN